MNANDYFERGRDHLDNDNYEQAVEDFWKAMEITHGPDIAQEFREKSKEFDTNVLALFLMETLKQAIG